VVREIEVLNDAEVTILADRRKTPPYGLSGGESGKCGRSSVIRENGAKEELQGKTSVRLRRGERVRIESPGGGGWGKS
jgi:N-methylhydantoinase B